MPIDWERILPTLIGAGAQLGGNIYGAKTQAGSIDKAAQIGAQTAQQQLNATLAMYGLQRGDRAPLRAVGVNALNTLQNWKPGQQNALSPTNLSQFKPNQVDLPPQLSSMTTGGAGNAFSPPSFGDISTQGIHSRLGGVASGALGGLGFGGAAKLGANAFLSPAKAAALGPISLAAGPAIGAIKGLFDNNNSDKSFATTGIERVGPWVWNSILPAVKSGQMSPDQAEQAVNQTLQQWEASMRNTPNFNQDVLQRSVTSQRQYLQPFFDEMNRLKGGQQGVA